MNVIYNFKTDNPNPRITFATEGGGNWSVWDRFLMIDGQKAYHIGNICGTCNFFFTKDENANRMFSTDLSAKQIAERLNTGSDLLSNQLLESIATILPSDNYAVCLTKVRPLLVNLGGPSDYFSHDCIENFGLDGFTGGPHCPKTSYYIANSIQNVHNLNIYKFFIPLQQPGVNSEKRVQFYIEQMKKGIMPVILSISVLDIKSGENDHWSLANYILDGHHKIQAATIMNKDILSLSFISRKESVCNEEELKQFIETL